MYTISCSFSSHWRLALKSILFPERFCWYIFTLFSNNVGSSVLPVHFFADKEGQFECRVALKSGYDLRTLYIEATVTAEERFTQIEFCTQAIQPLTQNIPVVCQA